MAARLRHLVLERLSTGAATRLELRTILRNALPEQSLYRTGMTYVTKVKEHYGDPKWLRQYGAEDIMLLGASLKLTNLLQDAKRIFTVVRVSNGPRRTHRLADIISLRTDTGNNGG